MKQFLLAVSLLTLIGTQVSASSSAKDNCSEASDALTMWSYGGASEQFLKNRFDQYFAKNTVSPDDTFMMMMENVYRGIAQNKGKQGEHVLEAAQFVAGMYSCTLSSTNIISNWR